ncbi:MAG TPA: hypothetical protein PKU97_03440, partial [Kofleriaceae bacterium]|nr:hypothetical protein [Kofleriaceae bacterium]
MNANRRFLPLMLGLAVTASQRPVSAQAVGPAPVAPVAPVAPAPAKAPAAPAPAKAPAAPAAPHLRRLLVGT